MDIVFQLINVLYFFIILLGPVPYGVYLVVKEKKTNNNPASILLKILLLWCTFHIFIAMLLGTIRQFNIYSIIFINIVIFILGQKKISKNYISFSHIKNLLMLDFSFNQKIILTSIIFMGAVIFFFSLTQVITDVDSLWYHLTNMAKWYQNHNFTMMDNFGIQNGYPYSWEILCTLFMFPFKSDFMVTFPNFLSLFIFGLSIYSISRLFNVSSTKSMIFSSLGLSIPLVIENIYTLHIDLPLASFFLAGLYFALSYKETKNKFDIILFFSSLGVLFGIKTTGLIYGVVLFVIFLFCEYKIHITKREYKKEIFLTYTVGIIIFLFLGGYWYLRNYLATGNPLYLLNPSDIMEIKKTTLASVFSFTSFSDYKIIFIVFGSLIQLPLLCMMFQIIYSLIRIKFLYQKDILFLLIMTIITFVIYWNTPYSGDNGTNNYKVTFWIGASLRYCFPFIGMISILASVCSAKTRISDTIFTIIVIINNFIGIMGGHLIKLREDHMMCLFNIKPYIFLFIIYLLLMLSVIHKFSIKVLSYLFILFLILCIIFNNNFEKNKQLVKIKLFGNAMSYLSHNIREKDIICSPISRGIYLNFGNYIANEVIYIPIKTSFSEWINILKNKNITIISLPKLKKMDTETKKLISFIENNPSEFIRVSGDPDLKEVTLYRINSCK